MKTFLISLLVFFVFAPVINAQDEDDDPETVVLPASVMEKVVQKIIIMHFASQKRSRREVLIAERYIKAEWLPKMRDIKFTIVSDAELDDIEKEVHFFNEPTRVDGGYQINFGWGEPDCSATGETWQFEVVGDLVQVERTSGGWASGCSSH